MISFLFRSIALILGRIAKSFFVNIGVENGFIVFDGVLDMVPAKSGVLSAQTQEATGLDHDANDLAIFADDQVLDVADVLI